MVRPPSYLRFDTDSRGMLSGLVASGGHAGITQALSEEGTVSTGLSAYKQMPQRRPCLHRHFNVHMDSPGEAE